MLFNLISLLGWSMFWLYLLRLCDRTCKKKDIQDLGVKLGVAFAYRDENIRPGPAFEAIAKGKRMRLLQTALFTQTNRKREAATLFRFL